MAKSFDFEQHFSSLCSLLHLKQPLASSDMVGFHCGLPTPCSAVALHTILTNTSCTNTNTSTADWQIQKKTHCLKSTGANTRTPHTPDTITMRLHSEN